MRYLDLADLAALAVEGSEVELAKVLELLDTAEVSTILAEARAPLPPHEAAAALLTGLAAAAPLPAGNRRLALLTALHLLALNGLEVTLDPSVAAELFAPGADVAALLEPRVTARDPLQGELRQMLAVDAEHAIGLALQRTRRHRRLLASPGDLLMGVFRQGTGTGARALGNEAGTVQIVYLPPRPTVPEGRQALEEDTRKVLALALRAATTLDHPEITTGHLLLGLLDGGHAAELPANLDAADVRRRVLELLGPSRTAEDRLARLVDRLRAADPGAAAELEEVADLHRSGLDRLVEMVRTWRGDLFLEAMAREPTVAGLLGPRRLSTTARETPDDERLAGYLAAIEAYPRLSRAEELKLAQSMRDDARRRLIESNLRLVVTVARRYEGRGLPLADLVKEGNIGLLRAAEHFDPIKGYRFATFATWWVRQAIDDAIARRT